MRETALAEVGYHRSRLEYDERRVTVWREVCRYLQPRYIDDSARILEIGAGYCHFINTIRGKEKHAVDPFDRLPEYASHDVVPHVQSCVSLTSFDDAQFDVAFASNLFEHLTRDEVNATLRELRRVLRTGGRFILLQPNFRYCYRNYFDDYTHVQIFTDTGLSDLLRASGFRVADVKPKFLPFSIKSKLPTASYLIRLYLRSPVKPFAGQMLIVAEKE